MRSYTLTPEIPTMPFHNQPHELSYQSLVNDLIWALEDTVTAIYT
jgi:hypothetical protein